MIQLDKIKDHLVNVVAGVSVHYSKSDAYTISFVLLKIEKGKIITLSSAKELEGFTALQDHLDKKIPVWISVTGRSVISRKLDEDPGEKYLNHILPNAKESDFTLSLVKNEKNEVFVSALRSDSLESIGRDIHTSGYDILGYSIGAASIAVLFQYGLMKGKIMHVPGYQIKIVNEELNEILPAEQFNEEYFEVAGESISNSLALPFSLAFSYLTNHKGYDTVSGNTLHTDEESYFFKKINKYFALGSLVFLFLLLLINFFLFNTMRSKNQSLSDKLAYYEAFFNQRDSLRNEIMIKNELINQVGLKFNTRYGLYADRIASTVPKGVVLNELTINPMEDKIKANKPLHFSVFIRVKGESSGSILLNDWIRELNHFDWIRDIEIIAYEKAGNKGKFEFQILY